MMSLEVERIMVLAVMYYAILHGAARTSASGRVGFGEQYGGTALAGRPQDTGNIQGRDECGRAVPLSVYVHSSVLLSRCNASDSW